MKARLWQFFFLFSAFASIENILSEESKKNIKDIKEQNGYASNKGTKLGWSSSYKIYFDEPEEKSGGASMELKWESFSGPKLSWLNEYYNEDDNEWTGESDIQCCIIFNSDGTFEDLNGANGDDSTIGTWENLENGTYRLNVTFGVANAPYNVEREIDFFCCDNVVRYSTTGDEDSDHAGLAGFQYLHRENYNWQSCDDIPFNSL